MSVVFGLSIYTATGNSCTVGDENVLVGFFGGDSNKKVVLCVTAEKIKIHTHLHIRIISYPQDVS